MPYLILHLLFLISGCTGIPSGIDAVTDFDLNRYLGKWYEIARLDHRFERGLTGIHAEYSLRPDGGVKVVNSGFNSETGQRESVEGKAYFVGSPDIGRLRVSFFGPFYGGYNIIVLDKINYSYVMVAGPDRDYLWILSRTPKLDQAIVQRLLVQAKAQGFATEDLIFDTHSSP